MLAIIVISGSFLNYRQLVANADIVLMKISGNGGHPMHMKPPEKKDFPKDDDFEWHDGFLRTRLMSPEIMYEARYFTVNISTDGKIMSVNTESIAMVDEEDAEDYAELAQMKSKDKGFINDFRYTKIYNENDTCVIF